MLPERGKFANRARMLTNPRCLIGENPLWHPVDRKLYWCDIPLGRLCRFNAETHTTELLRDGTIDGTQLGGFTIQQDGSLLLFMDGGRIDRWTESASETLIPALPGHARMRFNDVIADPLGRVFCGTLSVDGRRSGNLLRLDLDVSLVPVLDGVQCSNGMAFSRDGRHFFHTDSLRRTITRFDYDVASGSITNPVVWINTSEADGLPDGVTIDAEDNLWSAQWGGGCVISYTPEGREQRRIVLPVDRVTSLTFGGDDLRTLFVTTSGDDHAAQNPLAGAIFTVNLTVPGVPEFSSRINELLHSDHSQFQE